MPKPVSAEEIQRIQLSILRQFREFCSKHHLRFYLAYGTLLGAVRHKGYIPWDDDIDLMMPRPDYLKFIELFSASDQGCLEVLSVQNNRDYFATFAKIIDNRTIMFQEYGQVEKVEIGVYIDIFPMDGLPEKEEEIKAWYKKTTRLGTAYKLAIRKFSAPSSNPIKGIIKTLFSIPFRLLGSYFFISRLEALGMTHAYDSSTWVACVTSDKEIARRQPRQHLEDSVLVEFEGDMYPAPSEWDKHLTNLYGDYMNPPPENKRQEHYYTVFWK